MRTRCLERGGAIVGGRGRGGFICVCVLFSALAAGGLTLLRDTPWRRCEGPRVPWPSGPACASHIPRLHKSTWTAMLLSWSSPSSDRHLRELPIWAPLRWKGRPYSPFSLLDALSVSCAPRIAPELSPCDASRKNERWSISPFHDPPNRESHLP